MLSSMKHDFNINGLMRTNKFYVMFQHPTILKNSSVDSRLITNHIEATQLPGMFLASNDGAPRFGYGSTESNPYSAVFDDITLVFLIDGSTMLHQYLYNWVKGVVNFESQGQKNMSNARNSIFDAYEVAYKDDYVTDLQINVSNESKDVGTIMQCTLYRAFPKAIQSLDLNWGAQNELMRVSVTFSYIDYKFTYTPPTMNLDNQPTAVS